MDQFQQIEQEPIDILIAKLSNDLLNEENILCQLHGIPANWLNSNNTPLCDECYSVWSNQHPDQKFTKVKVFVENKNKVFRNLGDKFNGVYQLYQQGFVEDLLGYSIDQRLNMIQEEFNAVIDKIRQSKKDIVHKLNMQNDPSGYLKFKDYLQNILNASQDNLTKTEQLLEENHVKKYLNLSQNLTAEMDKVIADTKQLSNELISDELSKFRDFLDRYIKIVNDRKANPDEMRESVVVTRQRRQQQLQQAVNKDPNLTLISLKKAREALKQMMDDHAKFSKQQLNHPKIKVKGGGSFGYSFTGAYGISSTVYEELQLCRCCKECMQYNDDMHSICRQLYELDYRDGRGWWVEAWFLFQY